MRARVSSVARFPYPSRDSARRTRWDGSRPATVTSAPMIPPIPTSRAAWAQRAAQVVVVGEGECRVAQVAGPRRQRLGGGGAVEQGERRVAVELDVPAHAPPAGRRGGCRRGVPRRRAWRGNRRPVRFPPTPDARRALPPLVVRARRAGAAAASPAERPGLVRRPGAAPAGPGPTGR